MWSAIYDDEGNVFVLFAYGVDPENIVIPDFNDPTLATSSPDGWTYSSRILDKNCLNAPKLPPARHSW